MNRSPLIIGTALVAGLSIVGSWAWMSQPEAAIVPERYVETPEEMAGYVELGGVGILTSENFVGHRIRVIEGLLINVGDEPVLEVDLHLTFRSFDGDSILESTESALKVPLEPGARRRYVFRFENLPPEWDYRVPEVALVRVGL